MENLFSQNREKSAPLAEILRPKKLEDFIGQEHILGEDAPLKKLIKNDNLSAIMLWGPPGTGKTSLASVIANTTKSNFVKFSAVMHGVSDLRKIVKFAEHELEMKSKTTILFVDEVHRLNKSQQDAFLPHTEKGTFILIGATTENPSFTINSSLLSRSHVFTLKSLESKDLEILLDRAIDKLKVNVDILAKKLIIKYADGDARKLISAYEFAVKVLKSSSSFSSKTILDDKTVKDILKDKILTYDRSGDDHYNVISAFIKSMRGSDPNAAVYYLARMLISGEDPRFIARRMLIFASEDVGLSDPHALPMAMSVYHASEKLGMPEIRIPLSHLAIYLSEAPRDNKAYIAIDKAIKEVKDSGSLPVPLHLRNATTELMKDLGYGSGYEYAHDMKDKKPKHGHLPEEISGNEFYNK